LLCLRVDTLDRDALRDRQEWASKYEAMLPFLGYE